MTDNLKKNITWNTVGSIAYLACQWLTTVAVVRLSSDFTYAGDLSLAMTISNLFVPIGLYKIRSFQVSDLSCEYSSGEYIGFRLSTIVLGFVFVLPYAFFTCQQSSLLPVYLYCIYKSIEVMVDVFHGIDQKAGNMIYCGMSMLLRGILSLLVFCAGMYISHSLVLSIVLMIAVSLPVMIVDARWASNFDSIVPSLGSRRCLNCFISVFPLRLGFFVALRLHPFRVKNLLPYWEPQCWVFIPRCVLPRQSFRRVLLMPMPLCSALLRAPASRRIKNI